MYDLQDLTFGSLVSLRAGLLNSSSLAHSTSPRSLWPSQQFGTSFLLAKEVTGYFQQHYPERSDKIFLLNAPVFFSTLWRLIKPIIDPRTTAKISISSKDRTELLR